MKKGWNSLPYFLATFFAGNITAQFFICHQLAQWLPLQPKVSQMGYKTVVVGPPAHTHQVPSIIGTRGKWPESSPKVGRIVSGQGRAKWGVIGMREGRIRRDLLHHNLTFPSPTNLPSITPDFPDLYQLYNCCGSEKPYRADWTTISWGKGKYLSPAVQNLCWIQHKPEVVSIGLIISEMQNRFGWNRSQTAGCFVVHIKFSVGKEKGNLFHNVACSVIPRLHFAIG